MFNKKWISIILVIILLVGLVGCGNVEPTNEQMTDEQIISAVKNAKFENHPKRTIGEYLDLFVNDYLIGETSSKWTMPFEESKEADEEYVIFHFEHTHPIADLSYGSVWIYFTYNKKDKTVNPALIHWDGVGFLIKDDLNKFIDEEIVSMVDYQP